MIYSGILFIVLLDLFLRKSLYSTNKLNFLENTSKLSLRSQQITLREKNMLIIHFKMNCYIRLYKKTFNTNIKTSCAIKFSLFQT